MTKEEFIELTKEYSRETIFYSFIKQDHPAFIKLMAGESEIIPWALERLMETIGHDRGDAFKQDNDPWLLFSVLWNVVCPIPKLPKEHAGRLSKIREYWLEWGVDNGYFSNLKLSIK